MIGVSPLKRSSVTFLHLILLLVTLVAASCGQAAARMLMSTEPVKMGVAMSNRRKLAAGDNATALNATTNLSEDAEVLLLLKAALTSDPYNVTRYWKPIGKRQLINPCRPWEGITCTRRRVTAINLFNQSLSGALPPALGRLSALRTLDLSQNRFTGPIPELTFASSLQVLDLGNNLFTGALPSSLGNLTNLTSLVVANNALTGAIPAIISQLRELNVSGNELSGAFPAVVGSLETLDISGNNVSGAIPDGMGSMVNLTVFDARGNALSGGLPAALGSCVALTRLDVSENVELAGSVPAALGNLTRLESLRMRRCGLSGVIPGALTGCVALREVDLSENALQGEVPFQGLKNLTVMRLGRNRLEGEFVSRVPTFTRLEELDATNNRLSGVIPSALGELALVKRIDLSENQLSGGIPAAIQNCSSLTELHLASNALTGGFAVAAGTLPALTTLNISHNSLNGTLPTLNHLTKLKLFDGSFNAFSGGIPAAFVDFAALQSLNVSSNRLAGEVPPFTPHDNVTARSFLNNTGLCGASLGIECGGGSNNLLPTRTIVYIAVGSAAGFLLLVVLLLFLVRHRRGWGRKGSKHSAQVSAELQLKLTPEEVAAATDGFNAAGYIGEGKMSTVHRGVLPDQRVVAVKRLMIDSADVDAELEALGHIRHKSLVKVLGYCSESKALVLEYMPHGSLAGLLQSPQNGEVNRAFDWTIRFTIAVEVAEGLKYLHAECRQPVVHGDLKPSNILFDASMEARVADFGIRRILAEKGLAPAASTAAHGYTPAEVVPSMKGDVYSFGILLLSMLTGKDPTRLDPSQTLPQWVRATVANSKALQHVLDPVLMQDLAAHQQRMAMVLGVALLCTRSEPQDRPHMSDVHKMLVHIRTKPNSGRRKMSRRRSAREVLQQQQQQQQLLPHTPSLSDWTPPPSQV